MGRLDNPGIVSPVDSVHDDPPDQFVAFPPSPYSARRADSLRIVTYTGLGRDIWTVPFNDITLMFKVTSTRR